MDYNWRLKDTIFSKSEGKVFSCFACAGGSTMGYKLAGFDVIGCNEIDPKLIEIYKANHAPKYAFCEPIQTFKNADLPRDLYELDILDGSPPCSSFSMAGARAKYWGKEKKFREGQAVQVLDTLFFDFIDLAKRLQPKIVVAENVPGLLAGSAKAYVVQIYKAFDDAGYYVQHVLLNAKKMGVPQNRERVFFLAMRKDLATKFNPLDMFNLSPKIHLNFNEKPILYRQLGDKGGEPTPPAYAKVWHHLKETDKNLADIYKRIGEPVRSFNQQILQENKTPPTLAAKSTLVSARTGQKPAKETILKISSFPQDFNFLGTSPYYCVGMSVPPIMAGKLAKEINLQWLKKL